MIMLRNSALKYSITIWSSAGRSMATAKTNLYVKGCGVFGAVGLPELRDAKDFQALPWPSDDPIVNVAAGWGHSAVLTEQGRLFHWGRPFDFSTLMRIHRLYRINNAFGRAVARSSNSKLFGEKTGYYPEPAQVIHGYNTNKKIVDVKASAGLTFFLTEEGKVYSYGLNRWMQCGVPMPTGSENQLHHYFPQHLSMLPAQVVQIDTGLQHAVALTAEGEVFTWGKGNRGQLGLGRAEDSSSLPKRVTINDMSVQGRVKVLKAKKVSAGFAYTAAITEDDDVYIWGKFMSTTEKTSGSMTVAEDQWLPRPVQLPDGRKAKEIVSSQFTLTIRANDDTLWCMGLGEYDRNAIPNPVPVFNDYRVVGSPKEDLDPETVIPFPSSKYLLKKGHKRVTMHSNINHVHFADIEQLELKQDPAPVMTKSFDIVLHKGQAYLLPLEIKFAHADLHDKENSKIVDYSVGWQHELLLVESSLEEK